MDHICAAMQQQPAPRKPRPAKKSKHPSLKNVPYRQLQRLCMDARTNGEIPGDTKCRGRVTMESALNTAKSGVPRSKRPKHYIRPRRRVGPRKRARAARKAEKSRKTLKVPKYLSGVTYIQKWQDRHTTRTIYLLGDRHTQEGECKVGPCVVSVEDFIVSLLDSFEDIDIFVEYRPAARVTKRPFLDLKIGKDAPVRGHLWRTTGQNQDLLKRTVPVEVLKKSSSLSRTYLALEGCLELVKNCPWKKARVHAVDVRNTMFGNDPTWMKFTLDKGSKFNTIIFTSLAGDEVVRSFFTKVFGNGKYDPNAYLLLAQGWLRDKRTRLNRAYRTLDKPTQTKLSIWLYNLLLFNLPPALAAEGLDWLRVRRTTIIVPKEVNQVSFQRVLNALFTPWVDLYFAVRYLRTYDVSESGQAPQAVNAVYYAGSYHTDVVIPLLLVLGYAKTWESKPTARAQCVDISDIPLPLF